MYVGVRRIFLGSAAAHVNEKKVIKTQQVMRKKYSEKLKPIFEQSNKPRMDTGHII